MIKKFLATASVVGLLAGTAAAVDLENQSAGASNGEDPIVLAAELDFDAGISSTAGQTVIGFGPSAGAFPTGNVLVFVRVNGATFDGTLDGSEVGGTATSVISSGGGDNGNEVTFLVSGADACTTPPGAACSIDIPLNLSGDDVSFDIGLETDAGAPVDNSDRDNRVSFTLIDVETAWSAEFVPSTTPSIAQLNTGGDPFIQFAPGSDGIIGTWEAAPNAIDYGNGDVVADIDLAGTNVSAADVADIDLLLSGSMNAYATGTGDVQFPPSADDIDAVTDEAEYNDAGGTLFGLGAQTVTLVPNGTTAIERSDYSLQVAISVDAASPLTAGATFTGDLQSVERQGTQITFPWTQSATQGAASGVNSVYRFGNLDNAPSGAVFVEVKNSTAAGYTNPGVVSLAPSIAANGEYVTNSSALETALGNYGRGDIEFTIEAEADTLTGRQFVIRNGNIQNVVGGNIDQDLN